MDYLPCSHEVDLWRVKKEKALPDPIQLCLDIDWKTEAEVDESLSGFQSENLLDMASIGKELSQVSIFNEAPPILTSEEQIFLYQTLEAHKSLPKTIALLWEGLIPLLMELALCVTDPEDTLQANVKVVRRVYAETRRRFGGLDPIFLNINVHDAFAAAMGVVEHPQDHDMIKHIVQGKKVQSFYCTPMGAFARQDALHALEVVLGRVWLNHHQHRLDPKQMIVDLVDTLSHLYWDASRSDLFDVMELTGVHSLPALEAKEREVYFKHFNEENTVLFIDYLKRNVSAMRAMRLRCQHRFKRFLLRDKRLNITQTAYFDLLSTKFNKSRAEPDVSSLEELGLGLGDE